MEYGKIFQELIQGIVKVYGEVLFRIVLYGSAARAAQTGESDIDIAIMLHGKETKEMKERLTEMVVDLELEYDVAMELDSPVNNGMSGFFFCSQTVPCVPLSTDGMLSNVKIVDI